MACMIDVLPEGEALGYLGPSELCALMHTCEGWRKRAGCNALWRAPAVAPRLGAPQSTNGAALRRVQTPDLTRCCRRVCSGAPRCPATADRLQRAKPLHVRWRKCVENRDRLLKAIELTGTEISQIQSCIRVKHQALRKLESSSSSKLRVCRR